MAIISRPFMPFLLLKIIGLKIDLPSPLTIVQSKMMALNYSSFLQCCVKACDIEK
jgi:hypothetical protein